MNEEVRPLVDAGKLTEAQGNALSKLEPDVCCQHRSWGLGRISSWELDQDRIIVDFEEKPAHAMRLQFASKSVLPLSDDHILAERIRNIESLQALSKDDPVLLIEKVLKSFKSSMSLDQLEETLKGSVVDEKKYRTWWDGTKKKLREDRRFIVPSKRNLPLQLRADDLSPVDALVSDFKEARDLKTKAKAVEAMVKDIDIFKDHIDKLKEVIAECNEAATGKKLNLTQVVELMLVRDQLQKALPELESVELTPELVAMLQEHRDNLGELLLGLTATVQRRAYQHFPVAFGDEWIDVILKLLCEGGARSVNEIGKFMADQDKSAELLKFLETGLAQRALSSEVLAWICRERAKAAETIFTPDLSAAIIHSIERDHYENESKRVNRLGDLLFDDATLIGDLLTKATKNQVRTFVKRLRMTPVFEDLVRRSLLARVLKDHPYVEEIVTGSESEEEEEESNVLVVSWESLEQRKKDYDELINKKIPENTQEIKVARSYGDLRENHEFKSAKEMQAVLLRQKAEMEQELSAAQGTDFKEPDISQVNIGTIVTFSEVGSGDSETFTLLGAWDTDLDKGIISYLSETGKALLESKEGEEVELPSEDGGKRMVVIDSIEAYAK